MWGTGNWLASLECLEMNSYGVFCKGVEIVVKGWLGFSKTLRTEWVLTWGIILPGFVPSPLNAHCVLHLIFIKQRELGQADVFFRS